MSPSQASQLTLFLLREAFLKNQQDKLTSRRADLALRVLLEPRFPPSELWRASGS